MKEDVQKALKEQQNKIHTHVAALRAQAFKIEVEVLEGGTLPCKAHYTDAGFDLYATEDITLRPGEIIKHPLNIRMKLPSNSWARIETKSGLGAKGMLVYAGVVDQDYRGIPHVIATNLNQQVQNMFGMPVDDFKNIYVAKGEKIAQMTMNPHSIEFYVEQVESVDTNTKRGEGGFGSTGTR